MDSKRNIRLKLQYNGANYFGWQIQPNQITIQEVLQNVISEFLKEEIEVVGCSRTDSKVHAEGYVCNFSTRAKIPADKLKYALNPKLPRDIVVIESEEVNEEFHSRYSCKGKMYTYRVINREERPVFQEEGIHHFKYSLDIKKMREAAELLIGKHDFSAFKSTGSSVKTSIRTIYNIEVKEMGEIIHIEVSGDGFLYNMVRIIAGTLLEIGTGKKSYHCIINALESGNRREVGSTAPAKGLYLSEVYYD